MTQLTTMYEWSPEEITAWRQWADSQSDSITRNKIHALLDVYTTVRMAETEASRRVDEAKALAEEILEIFTGELAPLVAAGRRKKGTFPAEKERQGDITTAIQDLIDGLTKIKEWKFPVVQKVTTSLSIPPPPEKKT